MEMHEADNEMEETHHQVGTDGGDEAGNKTNTSGAGDGTSGTEATREEEFTEVDPKSGLPIAPYEFAKSYGN